MNKKTKNQLLELKKDKLGTTKLSRPSIYTTKREQLDTSSTTTSDSVDVSLVCSTAWVCDSAMDVLHPDVYKTVNPNIPHIHDHVRKSTSHVGDVTKVYTKDIPLKDLGEEGEGSLTCLVIDSTVKKDYNDKVFNFYRLGKIKEHSIGLHYRKISLAINSQDKSDAKEKQVWDNNYEHVYNKDKIDDLGYFWLIEEAEIVEASCVLFGANPITPTLTSKGLDDKDDYNTKGEIMDIEELKEKLAITEAALKVAEGQASTNKEEGATSERDRVLSIFKSADTLGIDPSIAFKQVEVGSTKEAALLTMETVKDALDAAGVVKGVSGDTSTTKDDPGSDKEKSFMDKFSDAIDTVTKAEKDNEWGVL